MWKVTPLPLSFASRSAEGNVILVAFANHLGICLANSKICMHSPRVVSLINTRRTSRDALCQTLTFREFSAPVFVCVLRLVSANIALRSV